MTNVTDRRALLATEAEELAARCDALARRVTGEVDRVAAQPARDAAMHLVGLADLLAEVGQ